MTTTRTHEQHCRSCFKKLDAHTSVQGDHVPKEGDFTVCAGCGTISKYDKDLNLVPLVQEDVEYLEQHEETHILLQQAAFLIRKRNAQN